MRLSAAVILSVSTVIAQQAVPLPPQPPRDIVRRPEPKGTGVIRGRVIASDTGNPIRRAMVNLSPMAPPVPLGGGRGPGTMTGTGVSTTVTTTMTMQGQQPGSGTGRASMLTGGPRQATTDAQGAFEFAGLPAGSYRVTASPGQFSPQYLGLAYGAKRPSGPGSFDPGQPIPLAEGQAFDKVVIALPRGGVITGRVSDENSDPLARVQVYTMFFPPGSSRGQRMGGGGQTDDLGQFRLFGLQPGEYVVVAEAQRYNFVPPNAPPETEEDKIGYMTTYYPGTLDEAAAQRVRTRIGTETPGIEIRLVQGRLFRIAGAVTDSQGRPMARGNGQLARRGPPMGGFSSGFSTDEQGQFQMRNIPPGNYRLIIRMNRPDGSTAPGTDPPEMASVPLTVAGADLDNVHVMTTPGTTITGQVVFEQGPPPTMPGQMRVMAMVGNQDDSMYMATPQPAVVTPELTFTMKGLMGEFLLRASAPGLYVRSVMAGGEDITDTPREFKANDRVTITFTTRVSTVEGNVTDAKGVASAEAGIILFSEDKASWRTNSMRTRRSVVDANGNFRIMGLMPGRYLIAAIPRDRLTGPTDAAVFELLSKEATSLVLGDDEQRRVDLKVLESPGGQ